MPGRRAFFALGLSAALPSCAASGRPDRANSAMGTAPSPGRAANQPVTVCAHRGWLDSGRAENSLDELRRTTSAGPFMVEIDIRENADGHLVLMHDRTVDRTTTGKGSVTQLSDAAFHRLRLKNAQGVTREQVPFFENILNWAARAPTARLMLDIKDLMPHRVLQPVRQAGLSSRVVALTFSEETARDAFMADEEALISVLITSPDDLAKYRRMAGQRRFAAYVPRVSNPALFQQAHDAGLTVITDLLGKPAETDALVPAEAARFTQSLPIDIMVSNAPLSLSTELTALGVKPL